MNWKKGAAAALTAAMLMGIGGQMVFADGDKNCKAGIIYGDALVKLSGSSDSYDTEADRIFEVKAGGTYDFFARLDASCVQNQLECNETEMIKTINEKFSFLGLTQEKFAALRPEITVSELKYSMTLTITWDENLEIPEPPQNAAEGNKNYIFKSVNDKFEVESYQLKKNVLTVVMGLRNKDKDYQKYNDFYNMVMHEQATKELTLEIKGVKVKSNAPKNVRFTSIGKITGEFSAQASYMGVSFPQEFSWTSAQAEDGTDFILKDSTSEPKAIQITLQIPETNTPNPPSPNIPSVPGYFKPVVPPTKPEPSAKPKTPLKEEKKDSVPNTAAHAA